MPAMIDNLDQTTCLMLQYLQRVSLVLPDGSRHLLRLSGHTDFFGDGYYAFDTNGHAVDPVAACNITPPNDISTGLTYYTADGTFLTVSIPYDSRCSPTNENTYSACLTAKVFWVYFPDGSQDFVGGPGGDQLFTRGGAGYSVSGSYIQDSTGIQYFQGIIDEGDYRQILIIHQPQQDIITYPGYGGATLTTTVTWITTGAQPRDYMCGNSTYYCSLEAQTAEVVADVFLPLAFCDTPSQCGAGYGFTYNSDGGLPGLGELNFLQTPVGEAQINYRYKYDSGPPSQTPGWWAYLRDSVTSKTLTFLSDYSAPSELSQYNVGDVQTVVTAPDGGNTTYTFANTSPLITINTGLGGYVSTITYADGSRLDRQWGELWTHPAGQTIYENPAVLAEYRRVAGQVSASVYQYDQNGNVIQKSEFDWEPSSFAPSCAPSCPPGTALGLQSGLSRITTRTYLYAPQPTPGACTGDTNSYRCAGALFRSAVATSQTSGALGTAGFAEYTYTNPGFGLQVQDERRWDSTKLATVPTPTACYPNCLSTATASVTSYTYDAYGNVLSVTEPGLSGGVRPVTQYVYDNQIVNSFDYPSMFLSSATKASGTSVATTTLYFPDIYTGLPMAVYEDLANGTYTQNTYDALGRLTLVQEDLNDPYGHERDTAYYYSLNNRCKTTQSDFALVNGVTQKVASVEFYDGLGRLWRKRQIEDGSAPTCDRTQTSGILADTQHLLQVGLSRYTLQSNPYRVAELGTDSSVGWTLTNFDQMQRPDSVMHFAGSTAPNIGSAGLIGQALFVYNEGVAGITGVGQQVTDESGNVTQTVKDGLGRVSGVVEYPSSGSIYQTVYTYDGLDNLYSANQSGQMRNFVYDSQGRLTCTYQPEMIPIGATPATPDRACSSGGSLNGQGLAYSHTYDANGNVSSRTDSRGAIVTYGYDALNRITSKAYGGQPAVQGNNAYAFTVAPPVVYCYDGNEYNANTQTCISSGGTSPPANSHGRLTGVGSSVGSSFMLVDAFGRTILIINQIIGSTGPGYATGFSYNLGGKPTSVTYPSGRTVNMSYDAAGMEIAVIGAKGSTSTTYVNSASYYANGGLKALTLGNNIVSESNTFTPLLLPASISAGTASSSILILGLTYFANRDVATQTINTGTATYSQSYGYDGVNRLTSAVEANGWAQTYCYDAWGNRALTSGAVSNATTPQIPGQCTAANLAAIYTNNHWTGAPTDVAGNVMSDGFSTFSYDSENRVVQTANTQGTVTYAYDGDGKRVQKTGPNGTTMYVYDADGNVLAEYSSQPEPTCGPCFVVQDQLGSTRMVTDALGNVIRRRDFYPFGEEIIQGTNGRPGPVYQTGQQQTLPDVFNGKFTGMERDSETGLDFFGARYFSGAQGRFTGADGPLNDQDEANPQSWSLYSYVRNNPLSFVDPSGTCAQLGSASYSDNDDQGGKLLFEGPCANGTIGETPQNNPNSVTAGVGWDEARLLMLQTVGESLSSTHQWATIVSGAGQEAMAMVAPLPTAVVQCITGNCSETNAALAMIPNVPGTSVGRYARNGKLRNILRDFNRTGQGVGTGSTADAIRHELQTGSSVGGKFHYTKGMEQFQGLLKLWRNPNLDPADRTIVRDLLSALEKALVR